jgi:hypothetical protein
VIEEGSNNLIVRNPEQIFSEIDGQVVMLNIKKEAYYTLNDVGSAIWKEIEHPRKFEELICILTKVYEVTHEKCREDLTPFLNELIDAGVVIIKYE